MEWLAYITGDQSDLGDLSKSLKNKNFSVSQVQDGHVLKSDHFASFSKADSVRDEAQRLLQLINGAARLALGMRKPLELAHITRLNDDGTRNTFVYVSEVIDFRASLSMAVVTTEGKVVAEIHPADPIPAWLLSAEKDRTVAAVLRFFAAGADDWASLYRICEAIERDVGGLDIIEAHGWSTKQSLRHFKHTANSPTGAGDDARHAKEVGNPPKNPMPFGEARSLIQALAQSWLSSKNA